MVLKIPNAASEQNDLPLINSWKALLWASLSLPYWRQVLAAKQFISVHKNNQGHPLCKVWSPRVGSCICCLAELNPAGLTGVKTSSFAPGTNLRVSPYPKSDFKAPRTSPVTTFHTLLILLLECLSPQIHSVLCDIWQNPVFLLSTWTIYWHMGALSKCLSNKCLSEQDLSIGIEKDLPTPNSILHSVIYSKKVLWLSTMCQVKC